MRFDSLAVKVREEILGAGQLGPELVQPRTEAKVLTFTPQQPIKINGVTRTRKQISRETGYTLTHVSRVFSGKRTPSYRAARKLAQVFGISTDEFMNCLPSGR